jgi:hypothetical protein
MTPLVGLIVGIVALIACRLCYTWGFRDGKREPQKLLGFAVQVDRRVPPDSAYFVDGRGVLVGHIKGIDNLVPLDTLKKFSL